ncbi:hypothetical protein CAAN1_22S02212 [[Candida] anglica]|uniref:Uncharacterized protein n=1 Tax=[Candida] anglica TaxID=148631 RepID=A0ABP0E9F8_9ASCO
MCSTCPQNFEQICSCVGSTRLSRHGANFPPISKIVEWTQSLEVSSFTPNEYSSTCDISYPPQFSEVLTSDVEEIPRPNTPIDSNFTVSQYTPLVSNIDIAACILLLSLHSISKRCCNSYILPLSHLIDTEFDNQHLYFPIRGGVPCLKSEPYALLMCIDASPIAIEECKIVELDDSASSSDEEKHAEIFDLVPEESSEDEHVELISGEQKLQDSSLEVCDVESSECVMDESIGLTFDELLDIAHCFGIGEEVYSTTSPEEWFFSFEELFDIANCFGVIEEVYSVATSSSNSRENPWNFTFEELLDIAHCFGIVSEPPKSFINPNLTWAQHLSVQKVVPKNDSSMKNKQTILRKTIPKIVSVGVPVKVPIESPVEAPSIESKDSDYYFDLPFSFADLDEIEDDKFLSFEELFDIVQYLGLSVEISSIIESKNSEYNFDLPFSFADLEDVEDDKHLSFDELFDIVQFLGLVPKSTPVRKLTWAEHLSVQKVPKKKAPLKSNSTVLRRPIPKIVSAEAPVNVPLISNSNGSDYYFDLPFAFEDLKVIEEFFGLNNSLSFDELFDIVQFLEYSVDLSVEVSSIVDSREYYYFDLPFSFADLEDVEDDKHLSFDELFDIVQFLGLVPKSTPVRKLTWAEHLSVQKVVPKKDTPLKSRTTILRKAVPKIVSVEVPIETPSTIKSKDDDYYSDLPFSSEDLKDIEEFYGLDEYFSFEELYDIVQFLGLPVEVSSIVDSKESEYYFDLPFSFADLDDIQDDKHFSFEELCDIVQFLGLAPKSTPVRKLTWAEHLSVQKVPKKKAPIKLNNTILRRPIPKIVEASIKVRTAPVEVPTIESKNFDYYFDLPFSFEDLKDIEEFFGLDNSLSFDELFDIVQSLDLAKPPPDYNIMAAVKPTLSNYHFRKLPVQKFPKRKA